MMDEPCVLLLVWLMFVNLREIESLSLCGNRQAQIRTILVNELVVLVSAKPTNSLSDACEFTHLFHSSDRNLYLRRAPTCHRRIR